MRLEGRGSEAAGTTGVSGGCERTSGGQGPRPAVGVLAPFLLWNRVSHLALGRALPWALMSASACLITSDPTIEEPVPTKPFLEFETATPNPRQVLVINEIEDNFTVELTANVRSEDAGRPVQVKAFLDYGKCFFGTPFSGEFYDADVAAGTFDETVRLASVSARFGATQLPAGCHRLTLMASHDFDPGTGCPKDPEDFSEITWIVYRCGPQGCGAFDPTTCPPVEASCKDFAEKCVVPAP